MKKEIIKQRINKLPSIAKIMYLIVDESMKIYRPNCNFQYYNTHFKPTYCILLQFIERDKLKVHSVTKLNQGRYKVHKEYSPIPFFPIHFMMNPSSTSTTPIARVRRLKKL